MTREPKKSTTRMALGQKSATATTIAKCVITVGLAVTTLSSTGCKEFAETQVVAVGSAEAANQAVDPLHLVGKISINHNETFLS